MEDLDALEDAFRDAQDEYREDQSDEKKEAFQDAKNEFVAARVEQRQSEELDPDNPRGKSIAQVTDEEGEQ